MSTYHIPGMAPATDAIAGCGGDCGCADCQNKVGTEINIPGADVLKLPNDKIVVTYGKPEKKDGFGFLVPIGLAVGFFLFIGAQGSKQGRR